MCFLTFADHRLRVTDREGTYPWRTPHTGAFFLMSQVTPTFCQTGSFLSFGLWIQLALGSATDNMTTGNADMAEAVAQLEASGLSLLAFPVTSPPSTTWSLCVLWGPSCSCLVAHEADGHPMLLPETAVCTMLRLLCLRLQANCGSCPGRTRMDTQVW